MMRAGKNFLLSHRDSPAIRHLYEDCQTATPAPIVQLSHAGVCRDERLIIAF